MKLPEPMQEVLLRCHLLRGGNCWQLGHYDGSQWYTTDGSWIDPECVLYWLELPNAS